MYEELLLSKLINLAYSVSTKLELPIEEIFVGQENEDSFIIYIETVKQIMIIKKYDREGLIVLDIEVESDKLNNEIWAGLNE